MTMAEVVSVSKQISADQFFRGLLAALAVSKVSHLKAGQPEIHKAFHKVMRELERPEVQRVLDVDLQDVDYDPLYRLSGWLDNALTWAQRDLIITFPNPSYDDIVLKYRDDEGNRVLAELGSRQTFMELAKIFEEELPGGSVYRENK